MPSRRSLLAAAVAVFGAGCSTSGESAVIPADHVPDDWHGEPERGLADPLTMDANQLDQRPRSDCPYLAADIAIETVEERLDNPAAITSTGCCAEVDGRDVAVVSRQLLLNREGEVTSSPDIDFQTVREATPRVVKASEESDHSCQVPVYVADRMGQMT